MAIALGLATCPIGFALLALDPELRVERGIPADMTPVAPIIDGRPSGPTPPLPRREPEIVSWRK